MTKKDIFLKSHVREDTSNMTYDEDYAYHVFLYGDLFVNILTALRQRKDATFHIPTKYKEITTKTVLFHNKWYAKDMIYYEEDTTTTKGKDNTSR